MGAPSPISPPLSLRKCEPMPTGPKAQKRPADVVGNDIAVSC